MTVRKHLKQLVRERMKKTGESYTSARRHVIRLAPPMPAHLPVRGHFPGNVPATTALRTLLATAGVINPHTKKPFSEAMVFGIAGGIGVGVCAFHYAKEDFSSFYVAGRHLWLDDLGYLKKAAERFGRKTFVKETSGARTADKQLREILAGGPCIAWVDMAHLPHRALPAQWSGGGYHVVTVYKIDGDTALLGDLTDEPVAISPKDLAVARARIKKQKHRLLAIDSARQTLDPAEFVTEGLRECQQGLTGKPMKKFASMFNLDAFRLWAERMHGSRDAQSWERIFPRGINLWRGLTGMHLFIEHYGTGGGLCRPLFAEFLTEAGATLSDRRLRGLAEQYAEIGKEWTALAQAALPDDVPLLRQVKECHVRYRELVASGGAIEEKRAAWAELDQLAERAQDDFPLSDAQCADLRAALQRRIRTLVALEQAAHASLTAMVTA